jgi:hypothetical protein
MSADFQTTLGHELSAAGIHGRLRSRILAEYADHLACDPDAQLGEPGALARQFADEVGSTRARRAAVIAFAALALAGVLFGLAFVTSDAAFGAAPKGGPVIGRIATALAILFSQVSFVAGTLAALRWVQRRGSGVLPAAEATVITLVAVPAQDVYDGAARGLIDALFCMAGFATLGRYLGLWSPRRASSPARS